MSIPFIDLAAQQNKIRSSLDKRLAAVLDHGQYVMGPEVHQLESELAKFCGAKHVLSCANGTDALMLALMALGVRSGDVVISPSFTFTGTAEMVPCLGAIPYFVDVDPVTYNIDPQAILSALDDIKAKGLKAVGVIGVDLFGLPADYNSLETICEQHDLWLISDTAQGFGANYHNRRTGNIGKIATTSFFPAKPLGAYGDGGAVFTNDDDLAHLIDSYRIHGKGADKYNNERIGMNSRLDTLQAAILLEKLALFDDEIIARNKIAARYSQALKGRFDTPVVPDGLTSTWAQYTLKTRDGDNRQEIMDKLRQNGIPSVVYYPLPLHVQEAYKAYPHHPDKLPVTMDLAQRVFSIPMGPYIDEPTQDKIIDCLMNK